MFWFLDVFSGVLEWDGGEYRAVMVRPEKHWNGCWDGRRVGG